VWHPHRAPLRTSPQKIVCDIKQKRDARLNIITILLQHQQLQQQNKATASLQHQKKTNATKKNYLLQHQTKATATTETKHNARCNI
jgi:ribosomal protein L3